MQVVHPGTDLLVAALDPWLEEGEEGEAGFSVGDSHRVDRVARELSVQVGKEVLDVRDVIGVGESLAEEPVLVMLAQPGVVDKVLLNC